MKKLETNIMKKSILTIRLCNMLMRKGKKARALRLVKKIFIYLYKTTKQSP